MKGRNIVVWLFAALSCLNNVGGGEVGNRKMLWAHYVPWFRPEDNSLFAEIFYNYPLQEAPDTPDTLPDSLRAEITRAAEAGLNGYFLDFGGDPGRAPAHWSWTLPIFLKAAEGTDFQVGICLDTKIDVSYWVAEFKRMLSECGDHPNYPKYNGRYVIATYIYLQWTAAEWREIRQQLKEAGYEIFVIANVAPLPNASLDLKQLEEYLDVYDCLYLFDAPGHANETPEENNRILQEFCRRNGKMFMPCLHPGYYGAWLGGFNDFYNPFRGFDMLHRTFVSAASTAPQWVHLTTWNDLVETAMLERLFSFGQTHTLRFYSDWLKGVASKSPEPDVAVAYLREALPGELLRIEAMSHPSESKVPITILGSLLDIDGNEVWTLPAQTVAPDRFQWVEWLIPTGDFARSPSLTPQITVRAGAWSQTVKTPTVFLVSPWLQNAVTVNVPLQRLLPDFQNSLAITQQGNRLDATVSFDAPVAFKRIMLFRNDRPVALFSPDRQEDEMLLPVTLTGVPAAVKLQVNHGRIVRALKKGQRNHSPTFSWSATELFTDNSNYGGHGITFAGSPELSFTVVNAAGVASDFRAADLVAERKVGNADATFNASPDLTTLNDTPLHLRQGTLALALFARPPQPADSFFVRYETHDGQVHFTMPIYPFAATNPVTPTALLATATTLESQSGGSGWCLRDEPEFLTRADRIPIRDNRVVVRPVSQLCERGGWWRFDGNGVDFRGDYNLSIPSEFFVPGGFDGNGQALQFDGQRSFRFPCRLWPMSGFGTLSVWLKPAAFNGKGQSVIYKDGWTDGLSINLSPDGKVEVIRNYAANPQDPADITYETMVSRSALTPDTWHHIEIIGDSATLRLLIDGQPEAEMTPAPIRSFGNGRVSIGGGMYGLELYRGALDELMIRGFPPPAPQADQGKL